MFDTVKHADLRGNKKHQRRACGRFRSKIERSYKLLSESEWHDE